MLHGGSSSVVPQPEVATVTAASSGLNPEVSGRGFRDHLTTAALHHRSLNRSRLMAEGPHGRPVAFRATPNLNRSDLGGEPSPVSHVRVISVWTFLGSNHEPEGATTQQKCFQRVFVGKKNPQKCKKKKYGSNSSYI